MSGLADLTPYEPMLRGLNPRTPVIVVLFAILAVTVAETLPGLRGAFVRDARGRHGPTPEQAGGGR